MRLTPDQIIAGIPARALRDCFKKLQGQGFGLQALAKQLSLPAEAAAAAVGHLLEAGLIAERQSNTKDKKWFELTTAGGQLAHASFAARFSRETAKALLGEVVANAGRINANDELTHRVTELQVFGSYLTDAADLGDLDIAYMLSARYPDRDLAAMSQARAAQSGRTSMSAIESLGYGETEVLKLITGGKRRVSLHAVEELSELGVEGLKVFPEAA